MVDSFLQFFGSFSLSSGSAVDAVSADPSLPSDFKQYQKQQQQHGQKQKLNKAELVAKRAKLIGSHRWGVRYVKVRVNEQEDTDALIRVLGSKCQTFYAADPLVVSRAHMQYVFDENGDRFLDCISNVQHVGHCHPRVVEAIHSELALSTCNIRFLSPVLTECAEALLATFGAASPLDTVLFCNSGSEANDLALQLARDWTGAQDMIVLEHAYHGHITTAVQMSPYKFDRGANIKQPDWVHVAPVPDVYRGRHRLADVDAADAEARDALGLRYASEVEALLERVSDSGRRVAALIAEPLQSCGGQVVPPRTYFPAVAHALHARGALLIADEVQCGFGRCGNAFWAHQMLMGDDGMGPDIVTMGKPMGNGYPVAAVVTRREIADRHCGGAEYFNTYGGNPVACAAALSVLHVLHNGGVLAHARAMDAAFARALGALRARHACVGDVRGAGMFWGVDLVRARRTREPAGALAARVVMRLRSEHRVLLNSDGPAWKHFEVRFKPPMCFGEEDLRHAVAALDTVLGQDEEAIAIARSENEAENGSEK